MRPADPVLAIPLSFFAGLLLTLAPLPDVLVLWRPEWLLLLLLYWTLNQPDWVGVWTAFACGILLDVIYGGEFGIFPASLCTTVYLARWSARRIRILSLAHTSAAVALLTLSAFCIRYLLRGFLGDAPQDPAWWLPVLSSAVCWPILMLCLQRWGHQDPSF